MCRGFSECKQLFKITQSFPKKSICLFQQFASTERNHRIYFKDPKTLATNSNGYSILYSLHLAEFYNTFYTWNITSVQKWVYCMSFTMLYFSSESKSKRPSKLQRLMNSVRQLIHATFHEEVIQGTLMVQFSSPSTVSPANLICKHNIKNNFYQSPFTQLFQTCLLSKQTS